MAASSSSSQSEKIELGVPTTTSASSSSADETKNANATTIIEPSVFPPMPTNDAPEHDGNVNEHDEHEHDDGNDDDDNADDDTIAILESTIHSPSASASSSSGGFCGALPTPNCSVDLKARVQDLKQKGEARVHDLKLKGMRVQQRLRQKQQEKRSPWTTASSGEAASSSSSLYDPSLYLCGGYGLDDYFSSDGFECTTGDDEQPPLELTAAASKHPEEQPVPASAIGHPDRRVCVVTTAALPWRTGTAVNPLLRALYLVRFQREERERRRQRQQQWQQRRREEGMDDDADAGVVEVPGVDASEEGLGAESADDANDDSTNRDESSSSHTSSKESKHNNEPKPTTTTINTTETKQPQGSITLVIPWLESRTDRIKLYGPSNAFSDGHAGGIAEQEEWIKRYCAERCGMEDEARELRLLFYPAFYLAGFGSIFPKVDLCNFIPRELVDVAILEEPEHLNWFRMPNNSQEEKESSQQQQPQQRWSMSSGNTDDDDGDEEEEEEIKKEEEEESEEQGKQSVSCGVDDDNEIDVDRVGARDVAQDVGESGVYGQKVEVTISSSGSNETEIVAETVGGDATTPMETEIIADAAVEVDSSGKNDSSSSEQQLLPQSQQQQPPPPSQQPNRKKYIEKAKLGWTHRFHFVVGIVHTNYEAYARQYGIGASLIAAPAIGAMSALTIRAYCHQVIKLSDTLPSFAPGKEVTCNVHGVRGEFLEGVDMDVLSSPLGGKRSKTEQPRAEGEEKDKNAQEDEAPSPVYFIGKLVWAKGFDLMLELQDIFRKRHGGEYFHIDVYGGGPDEKAIARAFHGRNHTSPARRPTPPPPSSSKDVHPNHPVDPKDLNAAAVFTNPQSIKDQSRSMIAQMKQQQGDNDGMEDVVAQYLSLGFEVSQMNGSATYVKESRRKLTIKEEDEEDESNGGKNAKNPLDILGDLSGKSYDTGVKTSQAVYNIADSSIKNILTMSFSQLKRPLRRHGKGNKSNDADETKRGEKAPTEEVKESDKDKQPQFVFDPPASRYEWRRHPIPAKFPGVIDHAQLKNVAHKIFLNPSTSEVLCTTTAEALAMNKFVILPKHPSNEFFLQFTNCLAYETLEECADKMAWALENTPAKLSEEERRKFTWEAATERLVESSIVTVKQARERAENGMDKTDARIAYWLSESGEKSNMIRNLFHKNKDGGDHSPVVDG